MKNTGKEPIDFVIAWVDGADKEWQQLKKAYMPADDIAQKNDLNSECRYRDWGLLKYWFRGVEKFAPWVNKVHFVTCGQIPEWLNLDHPKLNIVNHTDYIPEKYLPTFSSHCIELNFHRIENLAEQFVYFNDDMFLIAPIKPTDFFKNGKPCDAAILNPIYLRKGIHAEINDLYIINEHFQKKKVMSQNISKWITPVYGKHLIRTLLLLPYNNFPGFWTTHLPTSFLKKTFEEVWTIANDGLNETCINKFRKSTDVNQWLFQYWQYVKGDFSPRNPSVGVYYTIGDRFDEMCADIREQRYKIICCNDSEITENWENRAVDLQNVFQEVLSEKSSYEI